MTSKPYLEEHNLKTFQSKMKEAKKAGVLCNYCGTEVVYTHEKRLNATLPPSRSVVCPNCGEEGYKYE